MKSRIVAILGLICVAMFVGCSGGSARTMRNIGDISFSYRSDTTEAEMNDKEDYFQFSYDKDDDNYASFSASYGKVDLSKERILAIYHTNLSDHQRNVTYSKATINGDTLYIKDYDWDMDISTPPRTREYFFFYNNNHYKITCMYSEVKQPFNVEEEMEQLINSIEFK